MNIRFAITICFFFSISSTWQHRADATLSLSVLNTSVQVGGSGFVDVEITGAGELVQGFSLGLRIDNIGMTNSGLQFSAVQSDSFRNLPSYLFFNNSDNTINLGGITPVPGPGNDTIADNDFTADFVDTTVTGMAKLVGRFAIESTYAGVPSLAPANVLDDTFAISIVPADTLFLDSMASSQMLDFGAPATVSLSPASAAVPEPSAMALVSSICIALAWRRRRNSQSVPINI